MTTLFEGIREDKLQRLYLTYYRHWKSPVASPFFQQHCARQCRAIEAELTNRYGVPTAASYVKAWEDLARRGDLPF